MKVSKHSNKSHYGEQTSQTRQDMRGNINRLLMRLNALDWLSVPTRAAIQRGPFPAKARLGREGNIKRL